MATTPLWPLWKKATHSYAGPVKFKGTCTNCGEPRNRHCGRCKGCPEKGHLVECMTSKATGAWH